MNEALAPAQQRQRDYFLTWQCRIRQIAMRDDEGRPAPGMRPSVSLSGGAVLSDGIVTLLIPRAPDESTAFFRFQVQKFRDPRDVYEKSLRYLQSTHFQKATSYSDQLTAVFAADSGLARLLQAEGHCVLAFEQFSQKFRLSCRVSSLAFDDSAFQASLWHNRVFNPQLPDTVIVLGFQPDWSTAMAEPAPAA